jgi:hypothetical protein
MLEMLYRRNSTGSIQQWNIYVEDDTYYTIAGKVDGKQTITKPTTCKGKNIGLNSLIKLSKELKTVKYSKAVNWTEIEWINIWINHHMHRHIRPYPWVIYQAIELIDHHILILFFQLKV